MSRQPTDITQRRTRRTRVRAASADRSAEPIPGDVSRTIDVVRPIAIFFMMFVHVNPGYVNYGAAESVGFDWSFYIRIATAGVVGKASVPLLSVISGYLAARRLRAVDWSGYVRYLTSRVKVLYIPVLFWNALGLATGLAALTALGVSSQSMSEIEGMSPLRVLASSVLVLDNNSYVGPLNFLRDLLVVSAVGPLLVWLARSRAATVFAVAFVLVGSIEGVFAPVLYRTSILAFFYLGVMAALRPQTLANLAARRRWPWIAITAIVAAYAAQEVGFWSSLDYTLFGSRWLEMILRLGISWAVWQMCRYLHDRNFAFPRRVVDTTYLAYLSHMLVFGFLWIAWQRMFGDDLGTPQYVMFYLLLPFVGFVMALAAERWVLPRLPSALQIVVRGKRLAA